MKQAYYSITTLQSFLIFASALLLGSNALSITTSRRSFLARTASTAVVYSTSALLPFGRHVPPSWAATTTASREDLLSAISANRPESEILDLISQLPDPSKGRAASDSAALEGEWKLIWSAKTDAFSPLLKLPRPFKPDSYQYLGSAAAQEVGEGRLSQGLTGGILGPNRQLWLSSGAVVDATNPSTFVILPPFRLQLGGPFGSGQTKSTIVESGSDEDFRKLNARTRAAQLAGQNRYQQTYLENQGKGSLRISMITEGDPAIVGAVFVHQKL